MFELLFLKSPKDGNRLFMHGRSPMCSNVDLEFCTLWKSLVLASLEVSKLWSFTCAACRKQVSVYFTHHARWRWTNERSMKFYDDPSRMRMEFFKVCRSFTLRVSVFTEKTKIERKKNDEFMGESSDGISPSYTRKHIHHMLITACVEFHLIFWHWTDSLDF